MTIKSLLFILFLCLCLVWAYAAYHYSGQTYTGADIVNHGLFWTICVVGGVLALVILTRLFGWWKVYRAKAAMRPPAPAKAAPAVHEDDAALAVLIAEANAALARAPNYIPLPGRSPLARLPLYLLLGGEGAGKTSIFLNSGVEPQLLAGQAGGNGSGATRLGNIWLAKNAVFVELAGRVFSGDSGRWTALLNVLLGKAPVPLWRRLWSDSQEGLSLRGVMVFTDVRELTGASADPQKLERVCRECQDRLLAVGEVFGFDFPVYQVFSKCDKIPFFPDFFGRLPDSEISQILGCTLPYRAPGAIPPGEVFTEVEAKRLTGAFRPLYHSLAERRLAQLAHEPNPARKPGIYEFPRELKRIRAPLVQFLTDVFRPHPLQRVPVLRGFYLVGMQEVEMAMAKAPVEEGDWTSPNLSMETTRLFRGGDATQIFRPEEATGAARARAGLKTRWIFASDLFHQVVLGDRLPQVSEAPKDVRFERLRRGVMAAVCAVCGLLCLAFVTSWANNRNLLADVADAAHAMPSKQPALATMADLQALEKLRQQVKSLEDESLWYHWGLYQGNAVRDEVTRAYFAQFRRVLLNPLDGAMTGQLRNLSATPSPNDPYQPAYDYLKTHLMISSGTCKADGGFAARTLKQAGTQLAPDASAEWQQLAALQIDFYGAALARGNPAAVKENVDARDRARHYLEGIKSIEPIYQGILADTEKNIQKPQQLEDLAPNYKLVLTGKAQVSPAFSFAGWRYVQDAAKKANSGAAAESCVLGTGPRPPGFLDNDAPAKIQARYIGDYIKQWRDYVAGFSVLHYNSAGDAAKKLAILSDHKSPLLALFALTADATNFSAATQTGIVAKIEGQITSIVGEGKKKAESITGAQPDAPHQPVITDVTPAFQPVAWVVPAGNPKWVGDKNANYIAALAQLGASMQAIADSASPDPGLYTAASANFAKAMDAARQIEAGFQPTGVEGLDTEVQRLLEEPIQATLHLINVDLTLAGGNKVNQALAALCGQIRGTLRKYPFQAKSSEDTTVAELTAAFSPAGKIWQFANGPLADFAVHDGAQWKSKDPNKKPQVTPELLTFLTKAQAIATGFFSVDPAHPGFTFTMRPKLTPDFGDTKFDLEINGINYPWETGLQKQLQWPGQLEGANLGAQARLVRQVAYPFDIRSGLWGIFRIMGDAEPRPLNTKALEWRYSLGPDGTKAPIDPGAVHVEIVEFPAGIDLFNPLLYAGFGCPNKAVQ